MTVQRIADDFGVTRQAVEQAIRYQPRAGHINADREYVDPDRPHLSWIRLVCEPSLRRALVQLAEREQVSMSEVVRRACRKYIGVPE